MRTPSPGSSGQECLLVPWVGCIERCFRLYFYQICGSVGGPALHSIGDFSAGPVVTSPPLDTLQKEKEGKAGAASFTDFGWKAVHFFSFHFKAEHQSVSIRQFLEEKQIVLKKRLHTLRTWGGSE